MKIVLIYPLLSPKRARVDENKQFWPPLGLAYLAAVLEREGHKIKIIDRDVLLRKYGIDFERTDRETIAEMKAFGPDLAALSATTPNMLDVGRFSREIKANFPHLPVFLGGPHVTAIPRQTLDEFRSVDVAVIGEGERTVAEIAKGKALQDIKGIAYRDGGSVVRNAPREHIENLDDLPFPARHLLDMEFYLRPSRFTSRNLALRTTSIFTARGCPFRCTFCAGPVVFPGKVRFHSKERVLDEIDQLVAEYRVEALYFAEDMFLASRKRAYELLEAFRTRPWSGRLKWFAQARANIIDRDILSLMKETGCVGIEYGFESGSQRILDLMKKGTKVEENLAAAALTRRAALRFQANIIVGYPGETKEDFEATIRFLEKTRPSNIGFNIFMPLPGTEAYTELKALGKAITPWDEIGDPEMPSVTYAAMSREDFERMYIAARFRVILPTNLANFIKDNIKNPFRLVFLLATQFWGTLVKTARALVTLASPRRKAVPRERAALFVSYNSARDPLVKSQVIPYISRLSSGGLRFILLTFEKKAGQWTQDAAATGSSLKARGIDWVRLQFHSKPALLAKTVDIVSGLFAILFVSLKEKVKIVHARGVIAASMALIPAKATGAYFIFDMKTSLAEAYALSGRIGKGSFAYRALAFLEKWCVLGADQVIVETAHHKRALDGMARGRRKGGPRIDVLPCCVEMERFADAPGRSGRGSSVEGPKLVYLGSLSGWYMISEMLDFFKKVKEKFGGAEFLFLSDDASGAIPHLARDKGTSGVVVKSVGYEDVPRHLADAQAGILFKWPNERLDSFPVKVAEYLAAGLPLIINAGMGDVEDLVMARRVGVVVRSLDRAGYTKALEEFSALAGEGEALKRRCVEVAKDFLSSSVGLARYEAMYHHIP